MSSVNVRKVTRPSLLGAVLLVLMTQGFGARPGAAQDSPDEIDVLVARAVARHQDGDILGAIDAYQAILERAPERADVRSNLGAAYVHLGRLEEAIEQYRRALDSRGDDAAIRFNLGLALYKAARLPEAATELERVVEEQPENDNALLLLADCLLQLEENQKVIELLSPFEEEHREDRAFAYLLGTALVREDEIERGQVWLDRMLSGGDSAETRLLMGMAYMRNGDLDAAREELARAAELNPNLPRVHSLLGQVLQGTGDAEGADRAYRKELQINPNDFEANLYLGSLRREEGRYDEARAYLTRASRLRRDDPTGLHALGSLYLSTGELEKAREALEAVVKQVPEFEEAHVLLAMAYFRLGRTDDAERERAIAKRLTTERREAAREEAATSASPDTAPPKEAPSQEPKRR